MRDGKLATDPSRQTLLNFRERKMSKPSLSRAIPIYSLENDGSSFIRYKEHRRFVMVTRTPASDWTPYIATKHSNYRKHAVLKTFEIDNRAYINSPSKWVSFWPSLRTKFEQRISGIDMRPRLYIEDN